MEYKKANLEYRCDGCGTILVGYERNIFHSKDYICIKGKLSVQFHDHELGKRDFIHLIPIEHQMVTVCDLKCLDRYMKVQHAAFLKRRDTWLRNTASNQSAPPPPVIHHKRY